MKLSILGCTLSFTRSTPKLSEFLAVFEAADGSSFDHSFFAGSVSEARSESEAMLADLVLKTRQTHRLNLLLWGKDDIPVYVVDLYGWYEPTCRIEVVKS